VRLKAICMLSFACSSLLGSLAVLAMEEGGPAIPDWPCFRGDAELKGVAAAVLPERLELLWTHETGKTTVSSPIIAQGLVFIGCDDYGLHAIDLESGEKRWVFKTEDIIEAPPFYHDGIVYVGSSDFRLYAVDAKSGEIRFKFETEDKILGGANAWTGPDDKARILVGSYDSRLYCLDAGSGEKLWEYLTDNFVNGTPAVSGGKVLFGGCDAVLHVVDAATGGEVKRQPMGEAAHIAGSVAVEQGLAYFGHYGNEFVCVDSGDGSTKWKFASGDQAFFSSPAIAEDRVLVGGRDRKLHCLKKSDGTEIWSFTTRKRLDSSPVIAGDKVVLGSGDGRLHLLKLEDGAEIWSYEIGQTLSTPAVAGEHVVIAAADGRVYAFGPAETKLPSALSDKDR